MTMLKNLLVLAVLTIFGAQSAAISAKMLIEHCNAGGNGSSKIEVYNSLDFTQSILAAEAVLQPDTSVELDCYWFDCNVVISSMMGHEQHSLEELLKSDQSFRYCLSFDDSVGDYRVVEVNSCLSVDHCKTRSKTPPADPNTIPMNQIVMLKSYNYPSHCMRHDLDAGFIDHCEPGNDDFMFRVVPGLSGQGISLQSVNYPDLYLTENGRVTLYTYPANVQLQSSFEDRASFHVDKGLADENMVSFRSISRKDQYLRHYDFELHVEDTIIGASLDLEDSTFEFVSAIGPISASQGSTAYGGNASRAVDGNTNGSWGAGSVTHTNNDAATNWLQLDLGAESEIHFIEVFNRTDCCGHRLSGARVYVGSVPYNGSLAGFVEVASLDARNQQTYDLARSVGRYLLIKGAGSEFLSLAEVKVFGTRVPPVLISQGKSASQGSTYGDGYAARAVDGNTNGSWTARSVTHTNNDAATNWWQLDLGAEKRIDSIEVFNRTDCCGHRLSGARVYVGSAPYNGSLAGFVEVASLDARNQQTYDLAQSIGRYLLIKGAGSEPLSLAEVRVFGTEPPPVVRAYLQTSNGHYITASGGGGGTVGANRTWGQPHESFTLIDQNGGSLMSGDTVNLMAYDGVHYMVAEGGGGREVAADRPWAGPYETFTIRNATGADPIRYGDSVTLQAQNGHYVVAEGGGGGVVNANRPQVGPWEQFTLLYAP
jgi:hypothetical protein